VRNEREEKGVQNPMVGQDDRLLLLKRFGDGVALASGDDDASEILEQRAIVVEGARVLSCESEVLLA
jgi:hypothetical protein